IDEAELPECEAEIGARDRLQARALRFAEQDDGALAELGRIVHPAGLAIARHQHEARFAVNARVTASRAIGQRVLEGRDAVVRLPAKSRGERACRDRAEHEWRRRLLDAVECAIEQRAELARTSVAIEGFETKRSA